MSYNIGSYNLMSYNRGSSLVDTVNQLSKDNPELGKKVKEIVAPVLDMERSISPDTLVTAKQQETLNGVIEQIIELSPGVAIPKIIKEMSIEAWLVIIFGLIQIMMANN